MGFGSGNPGLLRRISPPGRGDSIFINPFLLKAELLPDIVAILEYNKITESGTTEFSPDNPPQ